MEMTIPAGKIAPIVYGNTYPIDHLLPCLTEYLVTAARKLFGGLIALMPENSQDFFTQAAYIAVCWLFLYFLYRKRVFLKV